MKNKKLHIAIILGVFIILLAAADVFVYTQGRQGVEHIQIKDKKVVEDNSGEKFEVVNKMDAFTVTSDVKDSAASVSDNNSNDEINKEEKDDAIENILSVKTVVEHSRDIYYSVNDKIKSFTENKYARKYTDYWDANANVLRKVITYPDANSDVCLKKYTAEYYYDKDKKLVFAFAYRKVNGKTKEYRAYYGTDGKLYRFINENSKTTDYKKGQSINKSSNELRYLLYKKGEIYLKHAYESSEK